MYILAMRFPCTITELLLPVALMAPHTIALLIRLSLAVLIVVQEPFTDTYVGSMTPIVTFYQKAGLQPRFISLFCDFDFLGNFFLFHFVTLVRDIETK